MRTREEIIVEHVTPYLDARQRVLEIGAGNGVVAQMLQEATLADFTLLDMVDYNQTRLPLHLHDGRALPFPDQSFDVAMAVFVLHHNPDPRPLVREALRVARNGVLIVENDVRGALKKPATRLIDSLEYVHRGVPPCYHTKSTAEWCDMFVALPARVTPLHTFKIGWFWNNVVLRIESVKADQVEG